MPHEDATGDESAAVLALKARLSGFETEVGRMKGLSLKTRASDIVIATTPKAGTTWVQQIAHQLRSSGSMDFEEISCVVPFLELAHDCGMSLDAEQGFSPRVFKSHCCYDHVPKGAKYIVVVREPSDVALSFYRFFEDWFFQPGEISPESFVREFWLMRGAPASPMNNAGYFHHVLSWWEHRHDPNVLLLFYEDLKENLRAQVERIALFMEQPADRVDVAVAHATFEFMSAHEAQFDERLTKIARNAACGLAPDAGMRQGLGKVRQGISGGGKALGPELVAAINNKWREVIGSATGLMTYEDFRAQWRDESWSACRHKALESVPAS